MKLKTGERVTVWVGETTKFGQLVRGTIYVAAEMEGSPAYRKKKGLPPLAVPIPGVHEWRTASNTIRLIDEKDEGVGWLRGWSDEVDRALRAARALL